MPTKETEVINYQEEKKIWITKKEIGLQDLFNSASLSPFRVPLNNITNLFLYIMCILTLLYQDGMSGDSHRDSSPTPGFHLLKFQD